MQRAILGFRQDADRDWVAELACGHRQHVRHDPPWQVRPWVLSEESRRAHLGSTLDCLLCDDSTPPATGLPFEAMVNLPPAAALAYADARLQGLCHEGAWEIAMKLLVPPSEHSSVTPLE